MAAPAEARRVQERSIATRAALLDAAIECLVDRGYAATTTIETARRAGVSRGAQLHHFPTKAQLLATAVEHLFDRRRSEFLEAFAAIDPQADRLDAAMDLLWSMFAGTGVRRVDGALGRGANRSRARRDRDRGGAPLHG